MWLCDNFIVSRYDGVTKCAVGVSHVKFRYEDAEKDFSVCDNNKACVTFVNVQGRQK